MNAVVRIGTRSSKLALWQASHVRDAVADAGDQTDVITISTKGDEILDVPLAEIGDKALVTKELDLAMLDGRIDLAVHSLKDLPTALPDGLELGADTKREDAGDASVARPSGHRRRRPQDRRAPPTQPRQLPVGTGLRACSARV